MPQLPSTSAASQFSVPKGQQVQNWLQINTFKPGIYTYRHMDFATNSVIATGPPGAADPATYGCMALPQGGLGMLPVPTAVATTSTSTYTNRTVQAVALDVGQFTSSKTLFLESIGYNGTTHKIRRVIIKTGSVTVITATTAAGVPSYKQLVKFPTTARMRTPWTAPLIPGKPQVVFVKQSVNGLGNAAIFPGLANTGIVALTNTNITQAVIAYNSRVISLNTVYYTTSKLPWHAQNFNYTTPFNSDVVGSQGSVVNPTNIANWSSWGSIESGELVVIQKDGGGFLMTGDINSLTVLRLPGLQSGGALYGGGNQATPGGFIYCSKNNGAWVWTGGATSKKISTNLADNFFTIPTTTVFKNYYCCDSYGTWIFFSNGWIFDLVTKGWWRVKSTYNYFFCCGHPSGMFLFPPKTHPTIAYFMSKTTTTNLKKFLWKSRPFRAATDRVIDIREIVLWVSITKTTATNNIAMGIYKTTSTEATLITLPHTKLTRNPQPFRVPYAAQNLTNFNVVVSGQSKSNITIWQITVGYNTRQRMKAVGV